MRQRFTTSFKIQAVEKALNRNSCTTLSEVAKTLGIGLSTLNKWTLQAKKQEFEMASQTEIDQVKNEKRPQDWSLDERLSMIIQCDPLEKKPSALIVVHRASIPIMSHNGKKTSSTMIPQKPAPRPQR